MEKNKLQIVFSSPGDLGSIRSIVNQVVDIVERTLGKQRNFNIDLRVVEHAPPGIGRAQQVVSDYLDIGNSDFFICVFWTRFGQPTGKEESGTLEEFLDAINSWKANGKPYILLYFKETPFFPKSSDDCDQIGKVMLFRESINSGKPTLFYKPFDDDSDFLTIFHEDLYNKISDLIDIPTKEKFEWNVKDGDININDGNKTITFGSAGECYYAHKIPANFNIRYHVKLLDIIDSSRVINGEYNIYSFHDLRFNISLDSTFKERITIIFPWENVSDVGENNNPQCRIAYQIIDRDLRLARKWDTPDIFDIRNHSRDTLLQEVYFKDRFTLKDFDLDITLNKNHLLVKSDIFDINIPPLDIPLQKFYDLEFPWWERIYIGIQSVNSMARISNIKLIKYE